MNKQQLGPEGVLFSQYHVTTNSAPLRVGQDSLCPYGNLPYGIWNLSLATGYPTGGFFLAAAEG